LGTSELGAADGKTSHQDEKQADACDVEDIHCVTSIRVSDDLQSRQADLKMLEKLGGGGIKILIKPALSD
jgi:hypothetical protein